MGKEREWRAWPLVATAALGYSASVLHVYALGPYIQPIQQDFGWTRAQVVSGITIANVLVALLCVPLGLVVDRYGPRVVGLVGVALVTCAFASLGTASGSTGNWIALWSLLAGGALLVQSPVWTRAVASRFLTSRGLAFALTLSGASVGSAIFPIMGAWLIARFGWRMAFLAQGVIWLVLLAPILLCWFRERAPVRASRGVSTTAGVGFAEGLRSPVFLKLLVAGGLFAFCTVGVLVHLVPILGDAGFAPVVAAAIASVAGISAIVGRLLAGVLLDRLPPHLVGAAAFLLACIAFGLLALPSGMIGVLVAAALVGLTLGAEVDVIAYLAAGHFGLKRFASLFGGLVAALALGAAFGPLVAGMVFDRGGTYLGFLLGSLVAMLAAALIMVSVGTPRPSAGRDA